LPCRARCATSTSLAARTLGRGDRALRASLSWLNHGGHFARLRCGESLIE
jgi:hypothetical protein